MKEYIKSILLCLFHYVARLFCIFPINPKKIVFEAYMGKQYSCNPKYICEYIDSANDSYELIWVYYKRKLDCKYKQVKRNSLLYFYHTLTAGVYIHNSGLNSLLKLRKKQVAINTWHGGGAYKRMTPIKNEIYNRENDFFLSSSVLSTKYVIREAMKFKGKTLDCGLPRNDILINYDDNKANLIKKRLGINDKKIVLYAPTFRADMTKYEFDLDYKRLCSALTTRFGGEWVVLYRGHYNMFSGCSSIEGDMIINATDYPDMQELLLIADVLITDYSGSIWDYSFLYRPIFLYAPDILDYNDERSFFVDIYDWGYPVCQSNNDLEQAICDFDDVGFVSIVDAHHTMMGNYETGHASKCVYEFIRNHWKIG